MIWEKITKYYWRSDSGYQIAASLVRGVPRYAAWAPVDAQGQRADLGVFDAPDQARVACDVHAREGVK